METKTKLVTYDDYQHLPDDGNRYEIIGGELFMTPSPRTLHQIISLNIASELHVHVSKKHLGRVFEAPTDIVLSMADVVQPDIMFVAQERLHIITEKNIIEAPDVAIEILSESTAKRDRNEKKELYEKHGVKEYWIVDPDEKQIEQFILRNESFELKNKLQESEKLTSEVIEGFDLELIKVFES